MVDGDRAAQPLVDGRLDRAERLPELAPHRLRDRLRPSVQLVERGVNQLRSDVINVRRDVIRVRRDVINVRHDVICVRRDVIDVRRNVIDVRLDVIDVSREVINVRRDVANVRRDVINVRRDVIEEAIRIGADKRRGLWVVAGEGLTAGLFVAGVRC